MYLLPNAKLTKFNTDSKPHQPYQKKSSPLTSRFQNPCKTPHTLNDMCYNLTNQPTTNTLYRPLSRRFIIMLSVHYYPFSDYHYEINKAFQGKDLPLLLFSRIGSTTAVVTFLLWRAVMHDTLPWPGAPWYWNKLGLSLSATLIKGLVAKYHRLETQKPGIEKEGQKTDADTIFLFVFVSLLGMGHFQGHFGPWLPVFGRHLGRCRSLDWLLRLAKDH